MTRFNFYLFPREQQRWKILFVQRCSLKFSRCLLTIFLRLFSLYFIRLVSQQNQGVIRFQTVFVLTQSSVTSVIIQRISVLSLFSNGKLIWLPFSNVWHYISLSISKTFLVFRISCRLGWDWKYLSLFNCLNILLRVESSTFDVLVISR